MSALMLDNPNRLSILSEAELSSGQFLFPKEHLLQLAKVQRFRHRVLNEAKAVKPAFELIEESYAKGEPEGLQTAFANFESKLQELGNKMNILQELMGPVHIDNPKELLVKPSDRYHNYLSRFQLLKTALASSELASAAKSRMKSSELKQIQEDPQWQALMIQLDRLQQEAPSNPDPPANILKAFQQYLLLKTQQLYEI